MFQSIFKNQVTPFFARFLLYFTHMYWILTKVWSINCLNAILKMRRKFLGKQRFENNWNSKCVKIIMSNAQIWKMNKYFEMWNEKNWQTHLQTRVLLLLKTLSNPINEKLITATLRPFFKKLIYNIPVLTLDSKSNYHFG